MSKFSEMMERLEQAMLEAFRIPPNVLYAAGQGSSVAEEITSRLQTVHAIMTCFQVSHLEAERLERQFCLSNQVTTECLYNLVAAGRIMLYPDGGVLVDSRSPVTPKILLVESVPCFCCKHYHGRHYVGEGGVNRLVCAMHPYGPEETQCPDKEI